MRTRNFTSVAICAVFASCASGLSSAADVHQGGGWISAPRISRDLVERDMVVEGLRIEVGCGGIAGLDMLPDGWTTSVESHGETTVAVVSKPTAFDSPMSAEDAKAQASDFDRFRFRVLALGEWSDCMSFRFSVDMQPRQRLSGVLGPLIGGARLSFRSNALDRWVPLDDRGNPL